MGKRKSSKMGRPKIIINYKEFEKLCNIQCTKMEIAEWFKVSQDTIERWCKLHYGDTFAAVFAQKRCMGKISLRREMFQAAIDPKKDNNIMKIWLSKQYLGMSDKQEVKQETTNTNMNVDMTKFKFVEPKED